MVIKRILTPGMIVVIGVITLVMGLLFAAQLMSSQTSFTLPFFAAEATFPDPDHYPGLDTEQIRTVANGAITATALLEQALNVSACKKNLPNWQQTLTNWIQNGMEYYFTPLPFYQRQTNDALAQLEGAGCFNNNGDDSPAQVLEQIFKETIAKLPTGLSLPHLGVILKTLASLITSGLVIK